MNKFSWIEAKKQMHCFARKIRMDILVLTVFVQDVNEMNEKGVMKTDRMNKFIGIKKIVEYVGDDVATKLSCKRILKGLCQNVCYPGKEEESLTETMVPLQKKIKTSQSLPQDEEFMLRDTKCIHYQVHYWSRLDVSFISDIYLEDNGLTVDTGNEEVHPLRFNGTFFGFIFAFL